jgi:hypothetical protein
MSPLNRGAAKAQGGFSEYMFKLKHEKHFLGISEITAGESLK